MRSFFVALSVVVLAVLIGCSEKGGIDVEKVKKDLTAEVDYLAGSEGQKYLAYDAVDAVLDGEKAKVTIKGLRILVPQGEPIPIGDIEMHAVPKGTDQYEISDLHGPSKLTFKAPEGDLVVDIGSQAWAGLWSTKYHTYLSADAKYGNVKLTGPATQGGVADLSEITFKSVSEDKGNGVFDQTGSGTLKTLTITGPEGSALFNSGEFKSDIKGVKLADVQAFARDWQSLILSVGEGKPADATLMGRLKGYAALLASFATHADLAGVSFKEAGGTELFGLEHLVLDGTGSGLDQPKVGLGFEIGLLGLRVPAADLEPEIAKNKQFIPSNVKLGYAFDDLPGRELWAAWLDLAGSGAFQPGNEAASEMAMQGFGMQLLQLANQAGSAFRITNLDLEAPAARFKMDGKVKGDASSPMGASGTANIEITGLDAIAEAAKQSMPPEEAAGAAGMFDMVRGFSNRETAADKVVDRYAVELAPTGQMTINGKPFDLFGAMMGGPPPQ